MEIVKRSVVARAGSGGGGGGGRAGLGMNQQSTEDF